MAYIGLDIGTSGCKAAVVDPDGRILAEASRDYGFTCPRPGWVEMEPAAIWEAVLEVLARLAPDAGPVRAMAVASIGESMVMTDDDGRIVHNAINYVDSRCRDAVRLVEPVVPLRELHETTGMPMNQMYSLNKLLWFRENMPAVLAETTKIHLFVDYFGYKLSGVRAVDPASASRTLLMDLRREDWSDDLLGRFGFRRRLFSPIAPAGTVLGPLLPKVAERTGLSPDVLVVLGSHDQPCGTLGSGRADAGDCLLSEGSSESVNLIIERRHITPELFDSGAAIEPFFEGRYFACAGQLAHGVSIRWFVELFRRELEALRRDEKESLYRTADRVCADASDGVFFLPYLAGVDPNDAMNNAKGCFVGLDVTVGVERLYRAVLEGLSFETRLRVEMLRRSGIALSDVAAAGGAAGSPLFMQMKADVLGCPVAVQETGEAGIMGLAVILAVAMGDYPDYRTAAKAFGRAGGRYLPARDYSAQYRRYETVNNALRAMYRRLA